MPTFMDFLKNMFGGGDKPTTAPLPFPGRDPDATMPLPELPSGAHKTAPITSSPVHPEGPTRRLILGVAQDVGRVRNHNEDVLLIFTGELAGLEAMPHLGLFIVADGMGGHSLGERASGIAARTMARAALEAVLPSLLADPQAEVERPLLTEVMEHAMKAANQAVSGNVPDGGTTLTCALLIGEQLVLGHVGDSRAYLITLDGFEQLTRDHSLVQRLVELGQLSPAEAAVHNQKNVLYRAVGQGEGLEIDVDTRRLAPGASLLICSDGLWGYVPDEQILSIIREAPSLQTACDRLIDAANAAGGPDNITAVMVRLPQ